MSDDEALKEQVDLLEGAVADTNRRLAASERRHAQQIEALCIEINAMKERLEAMDEGRNGPE